LLWCLLSLLFAWAQAPGGEGVWSPATHAVDTWNTRHGLPQNSVYGVVQDADGLIWVATLGGLARFDGRRFVIVDTAAIAELEAIRFRDVLVDGPGLLLAAEDQGLFRLVDGRSERLLDYPAYDLARAPDGTVWVATSAGVFRMADGPPRAVVEDANYYHVDVLDQGLVIASRAAGGAVCLAGPCERVQGLEGESVERVDRTGAGDLVAITRSSAIVLDRSGTRPPRTLHDVRRWIRWEGRDWAFDGRVLRQVDGQAVIDLGSERSARVEHDKLEAVLVDREGGLWVGLGVGGLARVRRPRVSWHPDLVSVSGTAVSSDGQVVYSSCSGGVRELTSRERLRDTPECADVWPDGRGSFLARGVDAEPRTVVAVRADGQVVFRHAPFQGMTHPVRGPWFSALGAAWYVPADGPAERRIEASDLGGQSLHVITDLDGEVWLLLDQRELIAWVEGRVERRIALPTAASVRDVRRLGELRLVGTYGAGLFIVDGQQVLRRLTPSHGLCDHAVSHFFDVPGEHVWFNSNLGVGRLRVDELEQAAAGDQELVSCVLASHTEGNGHGGLVLDNGALLVPTVRGLARIDPERSIQGNAPLVHIDRAVFGSGHDMLRDGATVRGPAPLALQWTGIHFDAPTSVRYRYRLLGLTDAWSTVSDAEVLQVPSLPPGRYRFEVMARSRGGRWSEPRSLDIERLPAWWERALVRVGLPVGGAIAVLLGLILALVTQRSRNRRLQQEIRQRVLAEQELRESQAHAAEVQHELEAHRRLEALGSLSGGIAHDFNNLLAVFSAHAESLAQHADASVRESAQALLDTVELGARLTRQLLVFGRRQPGRTRVSDVARLVRELHPMLRRLIREDIDIQVQAPEPLGVRADPGLIDRVVTNLVTNARDAIDGPGHIVVRVERLEQDGVAWVSLEVEDDGRGMDAETVERIFDPYYTTKDKVGGTGLGLATLLSAVRDLDGRIEVARSAPGQGTVMRVRLPEVDLSLADTDESPTDTQEPTAGLRVLIVDDDPRVLGAVVRLARRLGWTPRSASSVDEAREQAVQGELDLLLTDLVLRQGDGLQVRDAVRELQPGLPVVLMTGHPGDLITGLDPDDVVLHKPFQVSDLQQAVRTARQRAVLRR